MHSNLTRRDFLKLAASTLLIPSTFNEDNHIMFEQAVQDKRLRQQAVDAAFRRHPSPYVLESNYIDRNNMFYAATTLPTFGNGEKSIISFYPTCFEPAYMFLKEKIIEVPPNFYILSSIAIHEATHASDNFNGWNFNSVRIDYKNKHLIRNFVWSYVFQTRALLNEVFFTQEMSALDDRAIGPHQFNAFSIYTYVDSRVELLHKLNLNDLERFVIRHQNERLMEKQDTIEKTLSEAFNTNVQLVLPNIPR